jgi:hypothetical protein
MTTLYKMQPASSSKMFSNRYNFRKFKDSDAMHKFLCKGDNSLFWKVSSVDRSTGVYASQVGFDRVAGKATETFTRVGG